MTARSVQDWFLIIQATKDDLNLARSVLGDLSGYSAPGWDQEKEDMQQLVALFTAIRLDQMARENS